ncbi:MAG: OmpH family outer membrane protein [Gammaproteobacteria bacterium]|nr:OmpH family outer membrane protein [Gammaproteobacteria bacterium]
MKRILSSLFVMLIVCFGYAASASADLKIGYVNAARLLEEAPQAKDATKKLKDEFAPRNDSMMELQDTLKKMQDRLTRDAAIMSESERKKLGLDILARKRELQRTQDAFQEDVNIRRNDALGRVQETIKKAIEEVGKKSHFDMIFFDGISYANPDLDITDKVLDRLQAMTSAKKDK